MVYAVAIFLVSSMTQAPLPPGVSDKTGHGAAYAGFGVRRPACLGARDPDRRHRRHAVSRRWRIATAYGASDELHQRFVPGRTADVQDLRADATGAAGGIAIAWLVAVLVRVRKSRI